MDSHIRIRGAKTHNLKNIDLDIPRDRLIVITGLSGSGKSSLAFDTLYAEGQRRYVESLSSYARQFLAVMEKPEVDQITGLSPAISIEQKSTSHNPRSTVGTVTEIYDYLRLLFARVGIPYCPKHNLPLEAQSITQITDHLLSLPIDTKVILLAPIVQDRKGEYTHQLEALRTQGFIRIRLDGQIIELDTLPKLSSKRAHKIEVVVDRIKIRSDLRTRLSDSLETTLKLSQGLVLAHVLTPENATPTELIFSSQHACPHCGYSVLELEPRLFSFNNPAGACAHCSGLGCTRCFGTRLQESARHVFIDNHSLPQVTSLSIAQAYTFFKTLTLPGYRGQIAEKILKEVTTRLLFLMNVGLDYLNLHRRAETLSGGEAQRIRLASQIGAGLMGVMYVLDEPSIGLHQRDNMRLIQTLTQLRDLGNTVIVVEHDEEAIRHADHIIDIGPGAGIHGGHVIAQGSPQEIMQCAASLTGQYLSGGQTITRPAQRMLPRSDHVLTLHGARGNNLKNVTVEFPLGLLICVTGVSGSGKSTLINDTLYPRVAHMLNHAEIDPNAEPCDRITGLVHLDKVIIIDQDPIGRTPRSNPATYTGLLTEIRDLFAGTPEARARGYTPGRFSFNVKGGRCESCEGDGLIQVEMHFLADLYVPCDHCQGKRYNRETLDILYKGRNIHEILNFTVEEALQFFQAIPTLLRKLELLMDVGLAYIRLGQSATTLSGGEAQRIKLAKELSKRDTGKTLYILDEPTTGLHFHDIKHLLGILQRLRDRGNTLIVIEHNLDVIKTADWVIDLGPEGGDQGGEVLVVGTPEMVAQHDTSYTGQFLRKLL
jgi:excinuclease ABC subunit A